MSFKTLGLTLGVTVALIVHSTSAGAGPAVDNAIVKRNESYRKFFTEAQKPGASTPELMQKIVVPAQKETVRVLAEENKSSMRDAMKRIKEEAAKYSDDDSEKGDGKKPSSKTPGSSGLSNSSGSEEVVVDGADVPRELDFPGSPKATPAPPAAKGKVLPSALKKR